MKPDDTLLSRLYVDERRSLAEIGRLYGVHRNQVRRWLLRAGVPTRTVSEGTSLAQKGKPLSAAHRESVAKNLIKARAARTPEGMEKGKANLIHGLNKGKPWTPEERAKHMATRRTPEYRENLSASLRGEKNPRWKGGESPTDKRLKHWSWHDRRRECYERDNWTCRDCGCKCLNSSDSRRDPCRKIQAHHIVARRDGGTDDLENLVTVCMACHARRDAHRPKR